MTVWLGIDVLWSQKFALLEGKRVGLYTNPSGVNSYLQSTYSILQWAENVNLVALFAPEHGAFASAQDGVKIDTTRASQSNIPIYSLYGDTLEPTANMLEQVDVIVVDIQDIGVRYYTYMWTMTYLLEACGKYDVEMIVLDRPNPLGGKPLGPSLHMAVSSLVGRFPVAIQHGLTIGEMAILVNQNWNPHPANLTVIPCKGWLRNMQWTDTGLQWIPTSPNMPHFSTVLQYAGSCLLEGTNLSEGRGTTLPFEVVGAPWIDANKLISKIGKSDFWIARPHTFQPTISKYAGEVCHGVQIHVLYPRLFNALKTWLSIIDLIRDMYPNQFKWIEPPDPSQPFHFDRLIGIPNFHTRDNFIRSLKSDSSLIAYAKLWDNLPLYEVRTRS